MNNNNIDTLHAELFAEEYDCMFDSISEAKARRKGVNPMSQSYIDAANLKRRKLGVQPYGITENSPDVDKQAFNSAKYISSHVYCKQLINNKLLSVVIEGNVISSQQHNIDWHNDGLTLFEIAKSECDSEENVKNWLPSYLIKALKNNDVRAKSAIEDYLAGWASVL